MMHLIFMVLALRLSSTVKERRGQDSGDRRKHVSLQKKKKMLSVRGKDGTTGKEET